MPNFRWNNWTTDSQSDFATIAQFAPDWNDRMEAINHLNDYQVLQKIEQSSYGSEKEAARRRMDDLDY